MGVQMTKGRKHSNEFKRDAVALMENRGDRTIDQVADDLGVSASQLYAWRSRVGRPRKRPTAGKPSASTEELEAEVQRLKKELDRVGKERELLKKSIAFFVKENG